MKPPAQRVEHVMELKPDICSLDMGSMNMGGYVFVNTPSHLEAMAVAIRDAGVIPELEVFEAGHLLLAKRMIETGHIKPPGMFQICLGIAWGQPATPEAMHYMRSMLPPASPWFAFGISLYQFPMVAQAVLLGGHVRVGLEDNIYLGKGQLAPSNAALVEKAAKDHRDPRRPRRDAGRGPQDAGGLSQEWLKAGPVGLPGLAAIRSLQRLVIVLGSRQCRSGPQASPR